MIFTFERRVLLANICANIGKIFLASPVVGQFIADKPFERGIFWLGIGISILFFIIAFLVQPGKGEKKND